MVGGGVVVLQESRRRARYVWWRSGKWLGDGSAAPCEQDTETGVYLYVYVPAEPACSAVWCLPSTKYLFPPT